MDDIPKSIILVLLFITVLISVLGAWTVLDKMNSVQARQVVIMNGDDNAKVSLKVLDPNALALPRPQPQDSGIVSLVVMEPPGGE